MSDIRKSPVLREAAVSAQGRALGLPRHRQVEEAKASAATSSHQPLASATSGGMGGIRSQAGVMQPFKMSAAAAVAVTHEPAPLSEAAQRLIDDAREAAREEGLKEGLVEAQKRLDEAMGEAMKKLEARAQAALEKQTGEHERELARMQGIIDGLGQALTQRLDQLEGEAIELAFAAVVRVLGRTRGDRESVAAVVQQAIGQLRGGALLRVRLHPDDLAALEGHSIQARQAGVEWVSDSKVGQGGCLLDTEGGTLDARLDRQLQSLRDLWVRTLDKPAAGNSQEA